MLRHDEGEQDERNCTEDHLPGGQCQQVDWRFAAQTLDQDGAGRPAQCRHETEELAEQAGVHVPRFDDEQQAAQRARRRQPLLAAHALAKDGPGKQERPDRHGEYQNGRLARAAFDQRPSLKNHEAGDLRQADGDGLARGHQLERTAAQLDGNDQRQGSADAAFGGKGEGRRVGQALLGQHPGVAPG